MSGFRFRGLDGKDASPEEWLDIWAHRYPSGSYPGYEELIAKHKSLSAPDIVRIGKWKDGVKTDSKWKENVAMVAYPIWIQAASELPPCPADGEVAVFLENWSERKYVNKYKSAGVQEKKFGLSRATTLLHFLSGGHYPIFDSRVRRALRRLLGIRVGNTSIWYVNRYCGLFREIASVCATKDLRKVDEALFSYGDRRMPFEDEAPGS